MFGCHAASTGKVSGVIAESDVDFHVKDSVAWWDAQERTAHIAFVPVALSDSQRAEIIEKKSLFSVFGSKVKYSELCLVFNEGAKTASPQNLQRYYIAFWNFPKNNPMTQNFQTTDWKDYGKLSLTGDLKKGGVLSGQVAYQNKFNIPDKEALYRWDVTFEVPLN